jgi:hypothetical protein
LLLCSFDSFGDDVICGVPGLSGECMWLLLYKVLNEFVDSGISMDSNKLVEKFGIPQFAQHHDASDPAKQLYIELLMFSHLIFIYLCETKYCSYHT